MRPKYNVRRRFVEMMSGKILVVTQGLPASPKLLNLGWIFFFHLDWCSVTFSHRWWIWYFLFLPLFYYSFYGISASSLIKYLFMPPSVYMPRVKETSHVSRCCYSSPNFLCSSFPVLGSPLLLCQLNLHVSAYFLADDCKKPTTSRPSL